MMLSKNDIWNKALYNIQGIINKQSFDMWLKDTEPVMLLENRLTIKVADEVAQRHISDNYSSTLSAIVSEIASKSILCEFTTSGNVSDVKQDNSPEYDEQQELFRPSLMPNDN
jgi:chromosomal replication initiation ATPase DnaA